ncbi:hypothetical protein HYPSUDRAFT_209265 [Hypholoma sublateritium FD-334 SS-4]|uniref:Uncharacterized protein n=1 Tax=Hypholoma sublateritium (strain FD-334 SS-4) TaxID=945553 RepID=A0A0D2NZB5_HYPSF|nr:hypothetical protein HYPSUDRAFT_209265 [Hypholoma sublateritium FD-334 SS-4]
MYAPTPLAAESAAKPHKALLLSKLDGRAPRVPRAARAAAANNFVGVIADDDAEEPLPLKSPAAAAVCAAQNRRTATAPRLACPRICLCPTLLTAWHRPPYTHTHPHRSHAPPSIDSPANKNHHLRRVRCARGLAHNQRLQRVPRGLVGASPSPPPPPPPPTDCHSIGQVVIEHPPSLGMFGHDAAAVYLGPCIYRPPPLPPSPPQLAETVLSADGAHPLCAPSSRTGRVSPPWKKTLPLRPSSPPPAPKPTGPARASMLVRGPSLANPPHEMMHLQLCGHPASPGAFSRPSTPPHGLSNLTNASPPPFLSPELIDSALAPPAVNLPSASSLKPSPSPPILHAGAQSQCRMRNSTTPG